MPVVLKRVYDPPSKDDGVRILVDRLWPRGLSKEKAKIDHWMRDAAPSHALRKQFHGKPEKWTEFKRCYFIELDELSEQREAVETIQELASRRKVTLLFAAKDTKLNNAIALKAYFARPTKNAQSGKKNSSHKPAGHRTAKKKRAAR